MNRDKLLDFIDDITDDMTVMEMDFESHNECPEILPAWKQYNKLKMEVNKLVGMLEDDEG